MTHQNQLNCPTKAEQTDLTGGNIDTADTYWEAIIHHLHQSDTQYLHLMQDCTCGQWNSPQTTFLEPKSVKSHILSVLDFTGHWCLRETQCLYSKLCVLHLYSHHAGTACGGMWWLKKYEKRVILHMNMNWVFLSPAHSRVCNMT